MICHTENFGTPVPCGNVVLSSLGNVTDKDKKMKGFLEITHMVHVTVHRNHTVELLLSRDLSS